MKIKLVLGMLLGVAILLNGGMLSGKIFSDKEEIKEATVLNKVEDTSKVTFEVEVPEVKTPAVEQPEIEPIEVEFEAKFEINTIDDVLYKEMLGKSFKENNVIGIDNLRVLTLTYYGFDDIDHIGQMVVNQEVAEEVLEIFKALYEAKYPIEKINRVDKYSGDDDASMADNNTSSFNYRVVSGSENLSKHSYGMAIDINPIQNPYITSKGIFPPTGSAFVDRSLNEKGMIIEDDLCYTLFIKNGWTWGGHFNSVKDYQHFQKAFGNTK